MAIKEAGFITAGTITAYKLGEVAYARQLANRVPEGGLQQSIVPFMEVARDVCKASGLEVSFVGGPVKQSLCDPETDFDLDNRIIQVSDNPDSRTIKKATLYRPNNTVRDLDLLADTLDGEPVTPELSDELSKKASVLQSALNDKAVDLGFVRGPEVSLFGLEPAYDKFNLSHYATRTHWHEQGDVMTHSLGARQVFSKQPAWTLRISYEDTPVEIPTTSPVRILGRTLVRSLISRERDITEVYEAVNSLDTKGLHEALLGLEWLKYETLRTQLDDSLEFGNLPNIIRTNGPSAVGHFILAKVIAPLAPKVESSYIADMFQDPDSKVFSLAAKIMGASENPKN